MGAAALPVASIGVSGLKSVLTSVQDSQKIVEETEGLEDRSRIASEQARYQQTMAEREAAEIARQAGEDAEDAEKEYRRLRASQVAQMGASEDLEDIEAQANYDVGTSLLTGYNAVRQYLQQAEDYQEQADDLQTAYGQTSLTGNKSLLGQLLASANYLSS
jgi:hypothetical protein